MTSITRLTKTISGYTVELEIDASLNPPSTQCFVSKGRHSASLDCLYNEGVLSGPRGEDMPVHTATIDRLYEWATDNGY